LKKCSNQSLTNYHSNKNKIFSKFIYIYMLTNTSIFWTSRIGLGLWCLTPLSTLFQLYQNIVTTIYNMHINFENNINNILFLQNFLKSWCSVIPSYNFMKFDSWGCLLGVFKYDKIPCSRGNYLKKVRMMVYVTNVFSYIMLQYVAIGPSFLIL
jgi:hypothetical protein